MQPRFNNITDLLNSHTKSINGIMEEVYQKIEKLKCDLKQFGEYQENIEFVFNGFTKTLVGKLNTVLGTLPSDENDKNFTSVKKLIDTLTSDKISPNKKPLKAMLFCHSDKGYKTDFHKAVSKCLSNLKEGFYL